MRGLEDRSAGRWCAECGVHGSHHTDRHAEHATPEPVEASQIQANSKLRQGLELAVDVGAREALAQVVCALGEWQRGEVPVDVVLAAVAADRGAAEKRGAESALGQAANTFRDMSAESIERRTVVTMLDNIRATESGRP